jgi:effector-binding domain-containing protein
MHEGTAAADPVSSGAATSLCHMTNEQTGTHTAERQLPAVVDRAAQPYVGVREHITMTTFAVIADRFGEIFGWLAEHGIEPAGAPFFRYRTIDMERSLEIEAGVPVAEPVAPSLPVFADTLPAGRYVDLHVVGHPDELMAETARLLAWAEDGGLRFDHRESPAGDAWTSRLELYHTDPATEPDMAKWHTELLFKLADDS